MFTGIIRHLAKVEAKKENMLTVFSPGAFVDCQTGDSVAVEGTCLTIIDHNPDRAIFELGPETVQKTTLGTIKEGGQVNIELPLKLSERLGGHFVQGHVDGLGIVKTIDLQWMTIELPLELLDQIIKKGSIAINGISLTVAEKTDETISIMVMDYTLDNTTLKNLRVGDQVNIEIDMLSKYVAGLSKPYENQ